LARPPSVPDPVRIHFADFELDEANARLLRNGEPVALAPTPFNLLCALARRPGDLLTKEALLDAVWGHQFVSESVLKTAIGKLRTALGDDTQEPRYIETVSRRGYRFVARIADAAQAPPAEAAAIEAAGSRAPSSGARTDSAGSSAPGAGPPAASAPSSGWPASRASARRR
jgi:DNA-binding winged helix-turn-helix (wHTH) protein